MNEYIKDIALERQIRLVISTFTNVYVQDTYINFRCPICGDSKKNKFKKRGYILKNRKPWMYFCHNCFVKMNVVEWLKRYYPINYRNYYSEILQNRDNVNIELPKIKLNTVKDEYSEKDEVKFFQPILKHNSDLSQTAIKLCLDRKIPETIWCKWYVAIDGMYKNRLVIPFYDDKNKIYYYQGRSLYSYMTPKYLSRKGNYNNIYNYYTVNREIPVIILEGCIDSIFVNNSIGMTGVKVSDKKLKEFPNRRFLIDMDNQSTETKNKTIELLSMGEYVFCWKKFLSHYNLPMKDKWDINDVIIALNKDKFTYDELEPFFTNSIYDKVLFINRG
jgi:hypothetical protein